MSKTSFADILGDISQGELPEVKSDADTIDAAPPAGSPEKGSLPAADKPSDDPKKDATDGSGAKPDDAAAKPDAAKPDSQDQKKLEDTTPTKYVIDGEEITPEKLKEWRANGLRQDDYTRKRQADAKAEADRQQEWSDKQALARDVSRDPSLKKFLAAHPEAVEYLLEDPKAARGLIGKPEKVDQFWAEYEVLQENPGIAAKLAAAGKTPPEEVTEEIRAERETRAVVEVAAGLKHVVAEVAKRYDGIDPEEVETYLLELGGVPDVSKSTPEQVKAAFRRLYNLMYLQGEEGLQIDTKLIQDRFEHLSVRKRTSGDTAESAAKSHNEKVDAALKDDGRPPVTPRQSNAPAPAGDEPKRFDNLRGVLDDILGQ